MELTSIIGFAAGFLCILLSILMKGSPSGFIDVSSIFIVLGGTIASTIISYRGKSLKLLKSIVGMAFKKGDIDLKEDIEMLIGMANVARREGLLALEDTITEIDNPFIKKGITLIVDGTDTELIKNILETEVYFIQTRHSEGQAMVSTMATYAPAYGMIGTLIGLIFMLKNLNDSAALGPGMSTALVTTFYGVVLANLVFIPIAKKLQAQDKAETLQKELLIEGLLSIQEGENPRIIRDKLYSFLSRKDIESSEMDGQNADNEVKELENEK